LDGVKKAYTESLEWHLNAMQTDGDEIPEALQESYELEFELIHRLCCTILEMNLPRWFKSNCPKII